MAAFAKETARVEKQTLEILVEVAQQSRWGQ
jgi:hypothetical protein